MKKVFYLVAIASVLIVTLSITHYLTIFLPQKEQTRLKQQKALETERTTKRITNRLLLQDCLDEVNTRFQKVFEGTTGKYLTDQQAKILIDTWQKEKDECFRKYPLE